MSISVPYFNVIYDHPKQMPPGPAWMSEWLWSLIFDHKRTRNTTDEGSSLVINLKCYGFKTPTSKFISTVQAFLPHCRQLSIWSLLALDTDQLFNPASQRMHINVILSNNVRILCLSCKKLKTTATNCLKRAGTTVVLIVFMASSENSALIPLPFHTATQHDSGTRKSIYWSMIV